MNYPLISEYIESIKSAEDNFNELSSLRPVLNDDGDPIMSSGNFAVVFKMTDGEKDYAVKCFTKEQEGRDDAYKQITAELEFVQSSYLVGIKYLPNELFVDSAQTDTTEFPVVVMDWVDGVNLDAYIRSHIGDSYDMEMLAYQFCRMASWLLSQPFAHGDLKPDNILVRDDGTLVLVDYDGMFVPVMRGTKARELGSPDYRHPLRTADDFNEHTDDFALAVLALSLKALALQPSLLSNASKNHILFTATDYRDISVSAVFLSLRPLLSNSELERLLALFLLAHAQKHFSATTFQLFTSERPVKKHTETRSMWKEISRRNFDPEEIAAVEKAEIVLSKYGLSVCFFMKQGGNTYIPLSMNSTLKVGDAFNVKKAELIEYSRYDKQIYRVIEKS